MKRAKKLSLICATAMILVGLILFGGVMTALQWDWGKLASVEFETTAHRIDTPYTKLRINTNTARVRLVPSEESVTTVTCHEQENLKHTVEVRDGTLVIELKDTRKAADLIQFSFDSATVTVALPKGEYESLCIRTSTGDVEILSGITLQSLEAEVGTGDVSVYASVQEALAVKTSTGDVRVEGICAGDVEISVSTGRVALISLDCTGNLQITASTGKATLAGVRCNSFTSTAGTGDLLLRDVIAAERLSVTRTTGDVTLDQCDAAELFITTDTGDVSGSLRTAKVFLVRTNTGKINVPSSIDGGRCEISTSTGDVSITAPES